MPRNDRADLAWYLYRKGHTLRDIGEMLGGVSGARAGQMAMRGRRDWRTERRVEHARRVADIKMSVIEGRISELDAFVVCDWLDSGGLHALTPLELDLDLMADPPPVPPTLTPAAARSLLSVLVDAGVS